MDRQDFESRLLDLIEGNLSPESEEALLRTLRADPELLGRLHAMKEDRQRLESERHRATPAPASLVEDSLAAAEREALLAQRRPGQAQRSRALPSWLGLAAALALAALGSLAIWYGVTNVSTPVHPEQTLAHSHEEATGDEDEPDIDEAIEQSGADNPALAGAPREAPAHVSLLRPESEQVDEWLAELQSEAAIIEEGEEPPSAAVAEEPPLPDDRRVWNPRLAAELAREGRLRLVLVSSSPDEIRLALAQLESPESAVLAHFVPGHADEPDEPGPTTYAKPAEEAYEGEVPAPDPGTPEGYVDLILDPDATDQALARAIDDLVWFLDAGDLAVRLERLDAPDAGALRGSRLIHDPEEAHWWLRSPDEWSPRRVVRIAMQGEVVEAPANGGEPAPGR